MYTKATMYMIRNMDMVSSDGKAEINIVETIMRMNVKDMEQCTGPMEAFTKVTGSKEFNMVSV